MTLSGPPTQMSLSEYPSIGSRRPHPDQNSGDLDPGTPGGVPDPIRTVTPFGPRNQVSPDPRPRYTRPDNEHRYSPIGSGIRYSQSDLCSRVYDRITETDTPTGSGITVSPVGPWTPMLPTGPWRIQTSDIGVSVRTSTLDVHDRVTISTGFGSDTSTGHQITVPSTRPPSRPDLRLRCPRPDSTPSTAWLTCPKFRIRCLYQTSYFGSPDWTVISNKFPDHDHD